MGGPCTELAVRQTKWMVNMCGLAVVQAARFRSMTTPPSEQETASAVQNFANAAFVYRKRGFHSYFMDLVSQDTMKEFCTFSYVALCLMAGFEVLEGRLQVQEFVVLSA